MKNCTDELKYKIFGSKQYVRQRVEEELKEICLLANGVKDLLKRGRVMSKEKYYRILIDIAMSYGRLFLFFSMIITSNRKVYLGR